MALGLSNNGRYIVGTCYNWEGFIYDIKQKKIMTTGMVDGSTQGEQGANEFYSATDDGVAVGSDANGGIRLGIDGTYEVFAPPVEGFIYVTPMDVTPDGSLVVGYVSGYYDNTPCYWIGNEIHYLPFPNSKEAGFQINRGTKALWVSSDGSIIGGQIMNGTATNPLIYWVRQEDGTYEYVPVFKKYYEDGRRPDGSIKTAYETDLYKWFEPAAMSPDGKKFAMYIQRQINHELGIFDTETEEMEIVPFDRNNLLYSRDMFSILALSNNGYMTGFLGASTQAYPIILVPGEYDDAKTMTQAFPGVELLETYEDNWIEIGALCLLSGLSEDASVISGYIELEIDSAPGNAGFAAFYIETGINDDPNDDPNDNPEEDAVGRIEDDTQNGTPEYFTADGLKVNAPVKGLNIVRYPNGTTRKVIVNN